MGQIFEGHLIASGIRFAILATRWNDFIVERLVAGAKGALTQHGADTDHIDLAMVPGAYEIPLVTRKLAATGRYDGIIALGCVIRGATPHFDYVAGEAAKGIAAAMADTDVPISFGVLTVDTIEQAIERAGSKAGNKGAEAALACLETITLIKSIEEV